VLVTDLARRINVVTGPEHRSFYRSFASVDQCGSATRQYIVGPGYL